MVTTERAQQIADAPDHIARSRVCTKAEWQGYLWWMHDRDERYRPVGGEYGIEAAKLLIDRDSRGAV